MITKKLNLIMLITLLSLLLALTACGGSSETGSSEPNEGDSNGTSSAETYTIRIPAVVNEDNFVAVGFKRFKDLAEEKSDGRLKVDLYLNGTLSASNEEDLQLLSDGSVEIIGMPSFIGAQAGGIDGFNIYDFPFLFDGREDFYKLAEGPLGQELQEQFEQATGGKILGYYDIGGLSLLNSSHTIKEPSDLNGLNIRTPQSSLFMDTVSVMGGNPTPITFAEVYTSLQQGTIDGLTTTLPLMYDSQFYEVSKYLTVTNHVLIPYVFTINNDFFEGLPEDLQSILLEAAEEMIQFSRDLVVDHEVTAIKNLKAEGVEVYELTPEEYEVFGEVVQTAIEKNIDLVGEDVYNRALELLGK
ncbi:TRAP transporter substrate-binding protein [Alkalihalobacterium elongatum]|uniref:TRAP transporter substrate-binding protein n=1 Tax=Alkalihalobacterium elongatum TaxID=2675466 RepID=UPI001C1FC533|nr:TRAP transporter substrate-binding protein [Alkalihalobacterium elongatum]